jgi:hypothetical protein
MSKQIEQEVLRELNPIAFQIIEAYLPENYHSVILTILESMFHTGVVYGIKLAQGAINEAFPIKEHVDEKKPL